MDLTRSPEFDAREEEMCVKFDKRSRLTLHLLGYAGARRISSRSDLGHGGVLNAQGKK